MKLSITRSLIEREVWEFCFIDGCLYLDRYSLERRESTRHRKYKKVYFYNRLDRRDSNISESEVPLSDEMREAATRKFYHTLSCKKWSERSNSK